MGIAMEHMEPPSGAKELLPLGTQVGPWRVEAWAGSGVYGAVYRAVRVNQEHAGPIALKLALLPGDERFAREAHLLSRLQHPHVPRLWEHGQWRHPVVGTLHPYLAMEWVEGLPLYAWAQAHPPSAQQVLQVLAQLASALSAVHALGAVHRDVKGANVLMRRNDGRAFLTDFGTGIYPGAPTLTPPRTSVGTPAYRSPEAWLYELRFHRDPAARYVCGPADDLYALGVTTCRLLTGKYPDFSEPYKDANGVWQVEAVIPPAALVREGVVEPHLRERVLRLLSVRPEQRGTVAELAETLEPARPPAPPREEPIAAPPRLRAGGDAYESLRSQPRARAERRWLRVSGALMALALGAWWADLGAALAPILGACKAVSLEVVGPVGLGDDAASSSSALEVPGPSAQEVLAEAPLPEPLPGQTQPDAKGRCPHKRQVAFKGACWVKLDREMCEALNFIKNHCYAPVFSSERPSTSHPPSLP